MAEPLYSLNATPVSRGNGGTAARSCAYVMRAKLADSQRPTPADYADYHDPALFKGIFAPATAPAAWRDSVIPADQRAEIICQALEVVNDNSSRWRDARLGRHFKIALFPQLTLQQNMYIAQDWIKESLTRPGYVSVAAVHPAPKGGDSRNLHLHLFVPDRAVNANGFAVIKDRKINEKAQLEKWRENWAATANHHFARYGLDYTIDNRSYEAQGIDKVPQVHLGPKAKQLEEKGYRTELGEKLRGIEAENRKRGHRTTQSRGTMRGIIERDRHNEQQQERTDEAPKKQRRRGGSAYAARILAKLSEQQAAASLTIFDGWQAQSGATLDGEDSMSEPQKQEPKPKSKFSKLAEYGASFERPVSNIFGAVFDTVMPGVTKGTGENAYDDPEKKFNLNIRIGKADIEAGEIAINAKGAETLTGKQQEKEADTQSLSANTRTDMSQEEWHAYQMQGAVQSPQMDEEEMRRDY